MTSRFSYVDPLNADRWPKPTGKTLGNIWIPFTPIMATYAKNSSWRQTSSYGGHTLALNADHRSDIVGHWHTNASAPTDRARNEYTIFGTDKNGTGPSFRDVDRRKLFASYPSFYFNGYFGKGSSDGGRGYAWSVISKDDGCLSDVAGIKIDVCPCADNDTINEHDEQVLTKGSSSAEHNLDWQFNQWWAIYRDKHGNYTSIKLLPNGDNYENQSGLDDPDKGIYIFRNSTDDNDSDTVKCTRVGTDSHWFRGKYLETNRHITLYLLIPKNFAVPYNSMFVGFEFSTWMGTYSGSSREHAFQMNNCSVIPSYIAEQIRDKKPYQYDYKELSEHVIIPATTSFNDFTGDKVQTLKKYKDNDFGRRNLPH